MTHTQQIIQDAIEGEWQAWNDFDAQAIEDLYHGAYFLDPLFWQSVGKTRGWGDVEVNGELQYPEAHNKWHRFIDHLADGDDHETALSKLI